MKKAKWSVGNRVAISEDQYRNSAPVASEGGTIAEIVSDTQVRVFWDWQKPYMGQPGPYTEPALVDIADLITEAKAQKEFASLEKEWHKFSKPLITKMKEAAKLIEEVNKATKKVGFDLNEMYDLTSPLEQAMERAGWNTSSWNC